MVESSVFASRRGSDSLKSTVPFEVVTKLNLREGDKIEWIEDAGKILVRKKK